MVFYRKLILISALFFVTHAAEEYFTNFYYVDPGIRFLANHGNISPLDVWLGIQFLLALFLLGALLKPIKPLLVIFGIILLFESDHLIHSALLGKYYSGVLTSVLLVTLGVFFWKEYIYGPSHYEFGKLKEGLKNNWQGLAALFLLIAVLFVSSGSPVKSLTLQKTNILYPSKGDYTQIIKDTTEEVLPKAGVLTKIVLGGVVPTMVAGGIIDMTKVQALYKDRGGIPAAEMQILTSTSTQPLVVTADNAAWLVNLLWPIGLANKLDINNQSPIAGKNVNNYASTGGWQLGKEASGGVYFNKYVLIPLTPDQQQRVQQIAQNTYRPCCDNSSFFQDCNHGSAAVALIELGVSQRLPDAEIYKTLLAFNSYWFQQDYLETALYFKVTKNLDWKDVDPKLILSKDYSSVSGWMKNVDSVVSQIPGLILQTQTGGSCGA